MAKIDTKFAKESFTGLPAWAKGAIAIAVVGGIGYLVYSLIKKGKDIKESKGNRDEVKTVGSELDKLNSNSSTKQTLSASDASAIANKLFATMDGYGTDTTTIEGQLKRLKNQADWLAVRSAYGIREVSSGRFNPEPNYKGTLEGALTTELGYFDSSMRERINNYFTKQGIKATI